MQNLKKYLLGLIAPTLVLLSSAAFGQNPWKYECTKTATLKIYSSAFTDKETGDLDGYELAIAEHKDSTVSVFLYVYEGSGSEGIKLPGHLTNYKLSIRGNWNEHLIQYPSKKEIVQIHLVKISGTLTPSIFRGKLTIEGMEENQAVELKRVNHLATCNSK